MSNSVKKIECIARLNTLRGGIDEILTFLVEENILLEQTARALRLSPETAKETYRLIQGFFAAGKFQLLEYEWQLLPVERIKITIVTDRNSREFVYNF